MAHNDYTKPNWSFLGFTQEQTRLMLKYDNGKPHSTNDYTKPDWRFSGCTKAETIAILKGELHIVEILSRNK